MALCPKCKRDVPAVVHIEKTRELSSLITELKKHYEERAEENEFTEDCLKKFGKTVEIGYCSECGTFYIMPV